MPSNYDLSDPASIDLMKGLFSNIKEEDWEELIEFTNKVEYKGSFSFQDRGILMKAKKNSGRPDRLSLKQLNWIMRLVDQIDNLEEDQQKSETIADEIKDDTFRMPASHVTLRVAWHDNKWNGTICRDPDANYHCSGFNSLLSDRIRREKLKNIEQEREYSGQKISEIDYVPPCFWSVNLFGDEPILVEHNNPAASNLKPIKEELPADSMFSWPFAVSFNRTPKEMRNGSYPANLESVRIPRFSAKLHEGTSLGFMYAKYSNPLTEEEQQYLVVGCGLIVDKSDELPHFGPESEIKKIRENRRKAQNFPSMNWALRVTLENPKVRMPYHEYLEYSQNKGLNEKETEEILGKIKVAIDEPELNPCFKYVAMDIGDDEAIYILTKMRKSLLECRDDGIVPPEEMQVKIENVNALLKFCWQKRSHFPGFATLSKFLLDIDSSDFLLTKFIEDFKLSDYEDPDSELIKILNDPNDYPDYKVYKNDLKDLRDRFEAIGLSIKQFLTLSMLNLSEFQFERVIKGKLRLPEKWIKDFQLDVLSSHSVEEISNNPFLLFEEYDYWEDGHDDVYGDEKDSPIDLYKIDIAFFPDTRFLPRLDFQRELGYTDKRRLRAVTIRYLRTLENSGHCFSDAKNLEQALTKYPLFYRLDSQYQIPTNYFENLDADVANHFQENKEKVKIIEANDTHYFYLNKIYQAELEIEEMIKYLLGEPELDQSYCDLSTYVDKALNRLSKTLSTEDEKVLFTEERISLYDKIFKKRFFILAGGPGSGKSHDILNIISEFQRIGENCLLLAPTGKAALRLSGDDKHENIEASTIDKFLTDVDNNRISTQEVRSINNLIIDETSMVDLMKFYRLLKIINYHAPSFKRLIFVGDPDQLPAIGYGKVLRDVLTFLMKTTQHRDNFIVLQSNCRQELKESRISDLAWAFTEKGEYMHDIYQKISDKCEIISKGLKFKYWKTTDELYSAIEDEFVNLTSSLDIVGSTVERLNKLFKLKPSGEIKDGEVLPDNFQILTPYNGDVFGTSRINNYFQSELKKEQELDILDGWFKFADKVIRTKNYYEKGKLKLSNGMIGFTHNKPRSEFFNYPHKNRIESIDFKDIRKSDREFFDLAYAVTIHKAQGSGFNHVFLILPQKYGLLSKELIYTALTRTRQTLTIFIQESEKASAQELLDYAKNRPAAASRRTTLMLDKPYRHYNLEPEEGIYVQSNIELLIYHMLMKKRDELGEDNFKFDYEIFPAIDGKELPVKTDFTIYTRDKTWYWEHLGKLGDRRYEWVWQNVKKKSYKEFGIFDDIITTHQLEGINPSKIEEVIQLMIDNEVETEDKNNQYSLHHYSIR